MTSSLGTPQPSQAPRVLTVGETMILFDPIMNGTLEVGMEFSLRIAGAESNFAIGLARLGVPVRWISRLGADALGHTVQQALEREGVDLSYVIHDRGAPTGVFIKERTRSETRVHYYRSGSAASSLSADDVPDEALDGIELVHLSGITMALGERAAALITNLAQRARSRGITVMFDPNWRPILWASGEEAAAAQREVLPFVDWYVCGAAEGTALFGTENPAEIVRRAKAHGARDALVRIGRRGAFVGGEVVLPQAIVDVVDDVGAGDAFDAGFACGLLSRWDVRACATAGNAMAAAALGGTGDWETLPNAAELEIRMAG